MIARIWHGTVPTAKAAAFYNYMHSTEVSDVRSRPGNRGVAVATRAEGDRTHFWFLSLWGSFEEIRAFAGDDLESAVYYPRDAEFLTEFEPKVVHVEVPCLELAAALLTGGCSERPAGQTLR